MRFLGLAITEWAALLGIAGTLAGFIAYIFKITLIAPLNTAIDQLKRSIDVFSEQLKESKEDRRSIRTQVDVHEKRITCLENWKEYAFKDEQKQKQKRG